MCRIKKKELNKFIFTDEIKMISLKDEIILWIKKKYDTNFWINTHHIQN